MEAIKLVRNPNSGKLEIHVPHDNDFKRYQNIYVKSESYNGPAKITYIYKGASVSSLYTDLDFIKDEALLVSSTPIPEASQPAPRADLKSANTGDAEGGKKNIPFSDKKILGFAWYIPVAIVILIAAAAIAKKKGLLKFKK